MESKGLSTLLVFLAGLRAEILQPSPSPSQMHTGRGPGGSPSSGELASCSSRPAPCPQSRDRRRAEAGSCLPRAGAAWKRCGRAPPQETRPSARKARDCRRATRRGQMLMMKLAEAHVATENVLIEFHSCQVYRECLSTLPNNTC
jgi:hypothetical protein